MSYRMVSVKLSATVTAAALFLLNGAHAASGTWNGAQDAYWTNSANWSASPYPSGGDTATFNNAGNGQTTLDVAGLSSVASILFDTAGVAVFTLGSGGVNRQALALANNGNVQLAAGSASSQRIDAAVTLGTDKNAGAYTFRNDQPLCALTFAGNVAGASGGATAGAKTLNIEGAGSTLLLGNVTPGGASSLTLNANGSGALTLSGTNTLQALYLNGANGVVDVGAGLTTFTGGGGNNLVASQDCTITGAGAIVLSTGGGENYADNGAAIGKTLTLNVRLTGGGGFEYYHGTYYGTIVLNGINDYAGQTIMNSPGTISVSKIGNKGSTASNLGQGSFVRLNGNGARLLYTGTGETSDRTIQIHTNGVIEQAGSGILKFTDPISVSLGVKTLTLQGSGTGEFGGGLRNDAGTLSLAKAGTGIWALSSANTYTGATTVNNGTLSLTGAAGGIASSASFTINAGATLLLSNTPSANNANRLNDAASITLTGGTLLFSHDGGAASYSENAGALTVSQCACAVATAQASEGQTATLRFASLARTASATLNFTGEGLGESDRNRIFITSQADGPIGLWATVNGSRFAAYSSTRGVYADEPTYTDLAARGPDSVIPDSAATLARINLPGEEGPVTLAGDPTNSILFLLQNTAIAATVATRADTINKTLLTSGLQIGADRASLTIGESEGDGFLAALTPGEDLMLINGNPNALLTVNAAVANSASATSLTKTGQGAVRLTGRNSYSGGTALNEGTLIIAGSATQTLAGVISGAGALTKEGTGRLTLSGANTYSGATLIGAGVVAPSNNTAFGAAASGTVIASGAALDIGTPAADSLNMAESFTVSGTGTDGQGVIVNTGNPQLNAFGKVTLAGDATFGGTSRWDFRNNSATLTLNGHTLTKVGTNMMYIVNTAVYPNSASDTGHIDVASGRFALEAGTLLNGNANNTLTIRGGAELAYYNLAAAGAPPWTLLLDHNSRVVTTLGAGTLNTWAGPVTLNGDVTVTGNNGGYSAAFSGPVSGSGSLYKTDVCGAYLTGTNNTYSGVTVVSNGTLWAYNPGSLPGYNTAGKVTILGGAALAVRAGNGAIGWNKEQLDTLRAKAAFTANTAILAIDTTLTNFVYDSNLSQAFALSKYGNNSLTLTGTNNYTGVTRATAGTLTFGSTSSNTLGAVTVSGGAAGATLTISGPTLLTGSNNLVPGAAAGDRSMVNLSANVTMYDTLLANVAGAAGALYQTAGTLTCRYLGIGANGTGGYGYYRLTGGTVTATSYHEVGTYGNGVMEVYGGTVAPGSGTCTFEINRRPNAMGVLNVFGGLVKAPAGTSPLQMGHSDFAGPNARLNVIGAGVVDASVGSTTKILDLNVGNGNGGTSVVNLNNGGTLIANKVSATRAGITLLDFNGGTLRASPSTASGATFLQGLAAAVIYPGGAVIDTTNANLTINQPLLAPTGCGVTSIPLRSAGVGYIGAPTVNITGGSGTGTTAIATVDLSDGSPTKGQLTGLAITSPGFGYLAGDTVTVTLAGGGYTTVAVTNTGTLALNSSSGGLTKLGSGILTLGATNTYGGTTVISNGTLSLGVACALPSNANVLVAGGIYDLGNFTVTNGTVTVTAGAIRNGTLVAGTLTKTDSGTFALSASLSSPAPIIITEGTLRLTPLTGLYEGAVSGAFNLTAENPKTQVQPTTRMGNTATGWTDTTTYIYSGYLWNNSGGDVTWTFAENFDDSVLLKIDGNTLLNNGVWNATTTANYTLTPGAHMFEARFGQGSGGVGPVDSGWWLTGNTMGLGYDPQGRNSSVIGNYQRLADPGDGSLLTPTASASGSNMLSTATAVQVNAGATLDLCGVAQTLASLSGSGNVSNGTLTVTGTLAPGGTNTIGTLTLATSATLTGMLLADVAANGTCDRLAVQGNVDLSALALEIANPGQLNHRMQYTLVTCTGTRTGQFRSVTVPDHRWHATYLADGTVRLIFSDGTLIRLY